MPLTVSTIYDRGNNIWFRQIKYFHEDLVVFRLTFFQRKCIVGNLLYPGKLGLFTLETDSQTNIIMKTKLWYFKFIRYGESLLSNKKESLEFDRDGLLGPKSNTDTDRVFNIDELNRMQTGVRRDGSQIEVETDLDETRRDEKRSRSD